jgi:hypothetical protein
MAGDNGSDLYMSKGILSARPRYGYEFSVAIAGAHSRFQAGEAETTDGQGRGYYATPYGTIVFTGSAASASVALASEL